MSKISACIARYCYGLKFADQYNYLYFSCYNIKFVHTNKINGSI